MGSTHISGRVFALALALAVSVPFAGSSVAEATGSPAVGAVADLTWGISRADMDRTITAMADAGITWVRANVNWKGAEPEQRGVLNTGWLSDIDYAVTRAQAAGINVLMPISDGVPYWASADPNKYTDGSGEHWNEYWKPTSWADYASFAGRMTTRYSALGVHTYELWNEPNFERFWPSGVNAAEYASLLAATYPAVKAADPNATVLMGGLSKSDYNYLDALYDAGAAPFFDAANVHPYSTDPDLCWQTNGRNAIDAFCGIDEVRNVMLAHGDSSPLWLTEFGWSTTTAEYGVSESTQALYLTKAFTKLASYPYVPAAFWYNFRDLANAPNAYEANLGLLHTDFSQKPSYGALQALTSADLPPPPPTTDTDAPTISGVRVSDITRRAATFTWTTDEDANASVKVWTRKQAPRITTVETVGRQQTVRVSSLKRRTRYSFVVVSTDAAGNTATSATGQFKTA